MVLTTNWWFLSNLPWILLFYTHTFPGLLHESSVKLIKTQLSKSFYSLPAVFIPMPNTKLWFRWLWKCSEDISSPENHSGPISLHINYTRIILLIIELYSSLMIVLFVIGFFYGINQKMLDIWVDSSLY